MLLEEGSHGQVRRTSRERSECKSPAAGMALGGSQGRREGGELTNGENLPGGSSFKQSKTVPEDLSSFSPDRPLFPASPAPHPTPFQPGPGPSLQLPR